MDQRPCGSSLTQSCPCCTLNETSCNAKSEAPGYRKYTFLAVRFSIQQIGIYDDRSHYRNSSAIPAFDCWASSGKGSSPSGILFGIWLTSYSLRTVASCSAMDPVCWNSLCSVQEKRSVVSVIRVRDAKDTGIDAGY